MEALLRWRQCAYKNINMQCKAILHLASQNTPFDARPKPDAEPVGSPQLQSGWAEDAVVLSAHTNLQRKEILVAATVQHADAVKLVEHLANRIMANPGYHMTYSDAAEALGRKAANDARHVGQVTSRIDAACFYAKTPFLAMHRVRETHSGTINQRSFGGDLWRPHIPALVARAEAHAWSAADFDSIKRNLQSLGDDAATLLWRRIETFGEKGVQKALGA